MVLDVKDLKLVDAVAEHGSLTRAGTVLYLTQSALSRQLADLERRLGTTLFMRNGKRMTLTPAGERLRDGARDVLSSVARVVEEVRDVGTQVEAVMRVSTECYTCYHWLPGVLRRYRERFPRVEPRVMASVTRRPIPALLKGHLDLAIVSDPVRDRRIRLRSLFRDELMAVVPPGHPWEGRPFVEAKDIAEEHLFLYNAPRSELTIFNSVLDPAGLNPRQFSRVELTEAIVELVRAGLGVGVLARWAVAPHLANGSLRVVRVTEGGLQREWSAATIRRKEVPVHLQAFEDLLTEMVAPMERAAPPWVAPGPLPSQASA
jgi:LysR family transcriptional regulator, regulator for metE and metH